MTIYSLKLKIVLILIIFFGIFGLGKSSWAANFYVTPSGAGTGSGSDWSNSIAWSALSPARGTNVDNVYYLAGGTYSGNKTFSTAAGGNGEKIIFRKATTSNAGAVIGWQSSYNNQTIFDAPTFNIQSDYWTFDGVTGSDASGHGFWADMTNEISGASSVFYIQASHVTIDHMKISWPDRDSELYMNHGPELNSGNLTIGHGYRITATQADHFYSRCKVGDLFSASATTALDANNKVYDVTSGFPSIAIEIYGNYDSISLQYLYMPEIPGVDIRMLGGTNFLMEYCVLNGNYSDPWRHASGLMSIYGNTNHATVRYNKFMNIEGSYVIGLYGGSGFGIHNDWKIYGNIFLWDASSPKTGTTSYVVSTNLDGSGNKINNSVLFNNTFADIRSDPGQPYKINLDGTGNLNYNNIAYHLLGIWAGGDYSTDYSMIGSQCSTGLDSYTSFYGFLHHRLGDDCDYPDPAFAGDPFKSSSALDFNLASAEDAGYNVCLAVTCDSTNTYHEDMLGNTRTNWSRGAYEYVPGGDTTPAAAPTGLRVN